CRTAGNVLNVDGVQGNDGYLRFTFYDFSSHDSISPGNKAWALRTKIEDLNERATASRLSEVRIKVKKRD
ncbi:hypothetical protein ACW9H0_19200, partial [Pseudomonas monsensis]